MKRTLLLCTVLLALVGSGALLAAPAHPSAPTPDLEQLRQAIFQPAAPAGGLNPLAGALPMHTCVPTNDPCIDAQCYCAARCTFCGGIGSFTCNESTGASTCTCKGC